MTITLMQIEYFVSAVNCGSYTEAARQLYVSPQAVAHAVSGLEKSAGVALLKKGRQGVSPTEKGLLVYKGATEALRAFSELELRMSELSQEDTAYKKVSVAVATPAFRGEYIPLAEFDRFHQEHPRMRLEILPNSNGACWSALAEGAVDIALVEGETQQQGLFLHHLFSFQLHVMLSPDNRFADLKRLSLSDIEDTPIAVPSDLSFIFKKLNELCLKNNITLCFENVPSSLESHRLFLDRGGLILVANEQCLSSLYPESIFMPLDDDSAFDIPVNLAYRRQDLRQTVEALAGFLRPRSMNR